jgi:peptidoglycan hydrolase-like protein with peptidoglycan-binding domain
MRIVAAILVLLFSAAAAAGQYEPPIPPPQMTTRPALKKAAPSLKKATPSLKKAAPSLKKGTQAQKKATPAPAKAAAGTGLPLADRIAIQLDLAWTGDFKGLVDGELDDKTIAAIKSFQRGRNLKESGTLNPQERNLLAAAAKSSQAQAGWVVVDDPVSGARLGIPSKQVGHTNAGTSGTKWSTAQGQIQIETFRIREPGTTLAAVYEQQKKQPSTRRLALSVLRSDLFVLAGLQSLKRFYVRAESKDNEVRGVTVLFDQATEPMMDHVAVALIGSFKAFPGVSGLAQSGAPPRRKVEYATGMVVSASGHIVTDRRVIDGCRVIAIDGHGDADRQAEVSDVALLRIHGADGLAPVEFAAASAQEVTLVGIADPQAQDGGHAISTAVARLKGDQLEPPPQLGFAGAGALDQQGRVVGMVQLKLPAGATTGGAAAPMLATLVPAATIQALLQTERIAPGRGRTGVEAAKASVVRVICVRN